LCQSSLMDAPALPLVFDHYAGSGTAIALAVSGGGDSMALMDLYRRERAVNTGLPEPVILTIDHGLRDSFEKEAALVAAYCKTHGLAWHMLRWQGEKPKSGLMAAARLARYRLLAKAASDFGCSVILTGHTLNDQYETAAMRGARGAGLNLKGAALPMESDVLFERRVVVSRPLLAVSRGALRAHLAHYQIAFADDPSNADVRFERVRVRNSSVAASDDTCDAAFKASLAQRADMAGRAAAFILRHVRYNGGRVQIMKPHVHDHDAVVFALRYLAAALGGFDYAASPHIGARLATLLNHGRNQESYTAQRCRFTRLEGGLSVAPDPRHAFEASAQKAWPAPGIAPRVAPFEVFCGLSLLPLANALSETLGAPRFIVPQAAAI
jgi:tRNA(Ile)-lysidine synthase